MYCCVMYCYWFIDVLWCDVLLCVVVWCDVFPCTVMWCIVMWCIVVCCVSLCDFLSCIVMWCIVMWRIALWCIVVWCIVVCCVLLRDVLWCTWCSVMYCTVVSCVALQFYLSVTREMASQRPLIILIIFSRSLAQALPCSYSIRFLDNPWGPSYWDWMFQTSFVPWRCAFGPAALPTCAGFPPLPPRWCWRWSDGWNHPLARRAGSGPQRSYGKIAVTKLGQEILELGIHMTWKEFGRMMGCESMSRFWNTWKHGTDPKACLNERSLWFPCVPY